MTFFKIAWALVLFIGSVQASNTEAVIKNASQCELQKVYEKVSGYSQTLYPDVIKSNAQYPAHFIFSDSMGVTYKAHVRYDIHCDGLDEGEFVIFNIPSDQKTLAACVYSNKIQLFSGKQCDIFIDSRNSSLKVTEFVDR